MLASKRFDSLAMSNAEHRMKNEVEHHPLIPFLLKEGKLMLRTEKGRLETRTHLRDERWEDAPLAQILDMA